MAAPPLVQSAASKQYVRVPVAATIAGAAYNPTSDVVKMAFMTGSTAPGTSDLNAATWETDPTTNPPTYSAMCLVGPGGTVVLTPGLYEIWVQVTDSPEVPLLTSPRQLRVV